MHETVKIDRNEGKRQPQLPRVAVVECVPVVDRASLQCFRDPDGKFAGDRVDGKVCRVLDREMEPSAPHILDKELKGLLEITKTR